MPAISRFFGISIYLYYADHSPPHFHAIYNDYDVSVNIAKAKVSGRFPKDKKKLVEAWAVLHREELLNAWDVMMKEKRIIEIEALK